MGRCIKSTQLLRKVCSNCMNFKLCACLQMGTENKVQKALLGLFGFFFFKIKHQNQKKCSWLGFISVRTKLRRAWYIFLILNLDHFKTLCKIYCFSKLMGRNDNDATSTGSDSGVFLYGPVLYLNNLFSAPFIYSYMSFMLYFMIGFIY